MRFKNSFNNNNNLCIRKSFVEKAKNTNNDVKVIGITGSRGKSSTAYILHQCLKAMGYKSVLYSSVMVDSPASFFSNSASVDIPVKSSAMVNNIINEAIAYEADYLILEVNETTIEKGILDNLVFDVKVLTNYYDKHNDEMYENNQYKQLKKRFFTDLEKDCKCVLGLTGTLQKNELEEFLSLNKNEKIIFGSKYLAERRNYDLNKFDVLLHQMETSLNKLQMTIKVDDIDYNFETKAFLPHNGLNISCVLSILKALNILNIEKVKECLLNIIVPGRDELIEVNGRYILLGVFFNPAFDTLLDFKNKGYIKQIKVVTGAMGTGFKSWSDKYKSDLFLSYRSKIRKGMMNCLKGKANYVYLTSNDPAEENPDDICLELKEYLNNEVHSQIITDRQEAIETAIKQSQEGDLIFITGRGNRNVMCGKDGQVQNINDKEEIEKVITSLGW